MLHVNNNMLNMYKQLTTFVYYRISGDWSILSIPKEEYMTG